MYIEQKISGKFLVKKYLGKKISIKIDINGITKKLLQELTKKECEYIFETESYKTFENLLYNKNFVRDLLLKSRFLINNIEVLDILEIDKINNNFTETEILYKQGIFLKGWFNISFPAKFIYNSNNIEGSKIPEEEVKKIIENKKYIYKIKNEIQEVKNSKKAWDFLNLNFVFNEASIKKLYHILTKDLLQETGLPYPRGFKKVDIVVNNQETSKPENVKDEINNLIYNYKKNKNAIFPLQLAFDFHLKYEQIHPFENGNGRTGRLLMNKILIQNGMLPMIVFKENYKAYSNSISFGDKKKYYKFMLEQYKKTIDEGYKTFEKVIEEGLKDRYNEYKAINSDFSEVQFNSIKV